MCRVDQLYWFWLENPSASVDLSDSRVPIKAIAEAATFAAVESLGSRPRAAPDSPHVSLSSSRTKT